MNEDEVWLDSKSLTRPALQKREPKFDEEVSKIVGFPVRQTDPRLINLVIKWNRKKKSDMEQLTNDNHLTNPDFLIELKKVFNNG